MQVSHVQDHATHAIIGGGKAVEFGISSSTEFYNILSSTLYKDQILAVVREGLCNAWDAHIEAGTTHLPIEITIQDDLLSIKDSGKGIHKDDIGPIYCVYGNSTKKNDGKQTGGFGLGCKSPYAYVDHFEVISSHDGIQTIWNMSKASPQTGKPGAVPIASFPTSDTGLKVSLRIKNTPDRTRFVQLVKRIVYNGGMKAKLNGVDLPTIDWDVAKSNYYITHSKTLLEYTPHIMVRYGNVIYPVDEAPEIKVQYSQIVGHLAKMGDSYVGYNIVFQAPPHSIAVTPSRETLSMQEHTIITLKNLFGGFLGSLEKQLDTACRKEAEVFIKTAVQEKKLEKLLKATQQIPGAYENFRPDGITDLETMARRLVSHRYPDNLDFRKWDIHTRLIGLSKLGVLDRGLVHTYLSFMDKKVKRNYSNHYSTNEYYKNGSWLLRHVVSPLVAKMQNAQLDPKNLYVYDPEDAGHDRYSKNSNLLPVNMSRSPHHFKQLAYLRKIVVLSCSRMSITDRLYHKHPVFKQMGSYAGFLFYHVGMKKTDKEEARKFWEKSGMVVVDIIDRQDYEPQPVRSEYVPVAKREKKVGLPVLSCLKTPKTGSINIRNWRDDDAPRIEDIKCVVHLPVIKGASEREFGGYDREQSSLVVEMFGDVCGIAPSITVLNQYIGKGVPSLNEYVQNKLTQAITTRPSIQEYFAFNFNRVCEIYDIEDPQGKLLGAIYKTPELRKEFGIVNNLSHEDQLYIALYEALVIGYQSSRQNWVRTLKAHVHLIELNPANLKLVERIKGNTLAGVFSSAGLNEVLTHVDLTPAEKKKVLDAILTILN